MSAVHESSDKVMNGIFGQLKFSSYRPFYQLIEIQISFLRGLQPKSEYHKFS